jgi:hypothetical protein
MSQSSKIETIVSQFVADLREALTEESSSVLRAALDGLGAPAAATRRRGPGRPKKSKGAVGAKARAKSRRKGAKRAPEELEQLTRNLLATIKKQPGARIEEIGAAMAVPTKELALPIKKLLADKAISKRGEKRATKYTAK